MLDRLFKSDIPSIVLKGVPYFCNVYVIAKGKIISERLASTPLPASSAPPPRRMASVPYRSIDQTAGSMYVSEMREEFSVPETEISCISGDRMSTDSTLFDFYDNLGSTLSRAPSKSVGMGMGMRTSTSMNSNQYRRFAVSSACQYVDLGSADELALHNHETSRTSHPPRPSEEVEEKLRKLQLQIKQTMDMYHAACKEALTAKQQKTGYSVLVESTVQVADKTSKVVVTPSFVYSSAPATDTTTYCRFSPLSPRSERNTAPHPSKSGRNAAYFAPRPLRSERNASPRSSG
ncbi:uncharacterized protein LOC127805725 [Diospyros lotus]|uniref:uncharacterized protein LOC127805725 n=1 Tax=Diospyros lotus TaxID=55363 RepID=UPI002257D38A|nr:uncharacterized protein LOC127805725 [Diospyros lotus]